jgi:hypothetical protein
VDWNWTAANAEIKRAHELEPGNAEITLAAASLSLAIGRIAEGLDLANRAALQDPLGRAYWVMGQAHYLSVALDEAKGDFLKDTALHSIAEGHHFYAALVLLARRSPGDTVPDEA